MAQKQRPEDLIKQYLLNELSTTEQTALEDEYFLNRDKYEQLRKIEDELIDNYTRGTLSQTDCERFEKAYLSNPQRSRHVKFSKAFIQVLNEQQAVRETGIRQTEREDQSSWSWWSRLRSLLSGPSFALAGAALLLLVLGGFWFARERSSLHTRLAEAQREAETQQQLARTQAGRIAELETQTRELTTEQNNLKEQLQAAQTGKAEKGDGGSARPGTPSFVFALTIGALRDPGQESPLLIIPRGVEDVGLRLNLSEIKFPRYWVKLQTAEGKEMFSRKDIGSSRTGDYLRVNIPSRKFANGDNILSVSGISPTGEVETISKTILKVRKQ
ncbi:MAG: hypothetical protein J2P41_15635 [Blastocatellia bacterium]|nr:hypothetical protein [Blastocatellia bacterium]